MKNIYCPHDLKVTPHKGEIDANGEFIFYCQNEGCQMFVKFPQVKSADELNVLIAAREKENKSFAESRHAHDEANAILSQVLEDDTKVEIKQEYPTA